MKLARADHALWLRQLGAVVVVELRRTLWTRRATPLLLLAGAPVAATLIAALFATQPKVFDHIFTLVGVGVFFAAAVTQTKLLRGEIVAHTLHYHLLAPISRDVLLIGKYLAGFAGTGGVFVAVTAVCHGLHAVLGGDLPPVGAEGPPLSVRLAVVVLGCAAYGAVFLLFGALFRNPVLPVGGLLVWELAHFALPPTLQALSIVHHLQRMLGDDPAAPPAWTSGLTLIALALAAVALACRRLRRLEVG